MIQKVKDLGKLTLNPQDVMLLAKVKTMKSPGLDLDLSAMNDKDKNDLEKLLSLSIVAKGSEVEGFNIGELASLKSNNSLGSYESLNSDTTERIVIVHMNNIAYSISKENYEG